MPLKSNAPKKPRKSSPTSPGCFTSESSRDAGTWLISAAVDVSFLNMETNAVFGHVSSLNIYDPGDAPGGAGLEITKQLILQRMDQLAPFRRRLVEVPLGLDLPYWVEDPGFDLDFHVRHAA